MSHLTEWISCYTTSWPHAVAVITMTLQYTLNLRNSFIWQLSTYDISWNNNYVAKLFPPCSLCPCGGSWADVCGQPTRDNDILCTVYTRQQRNRVTVMINLPVSLLYLIDAGGVDHYQVTAKNVHPHAYNTYI